MTPSEIILLIVAIAFVILVVFLVMLTWNAIKTLNNVNQALGNLKDEPGNILRNATEITSDLNHKMKCLNPFFHSLSNVGQGLEFRTNRIKKEAYIKSLETKYENEESSIPEVLEFALRGLSLWQKYQNKR